MSWFIVKPGWITNEFSNIRRKTSVKVNYLMNVAEGAHEVTKEKKKTKLPS